MNQTTVQPTAVVSPLWWWDLPCLVSEQTFPKTVGTVLTLETLCRAHAGDIFQVFHSFHDN